MNAPVVSEDTIVGAITALHKMYRDWDREFWQHFVDGAVPTALTVVGPIPDVVRNHPLFEECMPGDEAARLDVETGGYEAVRKITAGDIVLDVGAHIGYFTRRALAAGADVAAVEPDPRNFRLLSRLLLDYPSRLLLLPIAASDTPGVVELKRSRFSTQHRLGTRPLWLDEWALPPVRVPMLPLDAIDDGALSGVTFIKIDVEEAELAVLHGLEKTIESEHPFITIEVTADMDGCAEFLRTRSYEIQATTHMHLPPAPMDTPIAGLWHCEKKESP